MFRFTTLVALTLSARAMGGCAHRSASPLPVGEAAYATIEVKDGTPGEDIIRPGDHLAIRVLGEPELTSDAYIVEIGRAHV